MFHISLYCVYSRIHDKGYVRWMPHINLVYPFIPDNDNGRNFLDASKKIQDALSDVEPFRVRFTKDTFKYFMHRKSCTLWLKPLPEGDDVQPVMSDPDGTPEKGTIIILNDGLHKLINLG